jgi:hypothetical protein
MKRAVGERALHYPPLADPLEARGYGIDLDIVWHHTHRGLRWTVSQESPNCPVIHPLGPLLGTRRPPTTAKPQKDSLTRSNITLAPSRSARLARCTLAFITSPPVSTKWWRLRPFAFLAPSYPRTPLFLWSSPTGCPRWPRSE